MPVVIVIGMFAVLTNHAKDPLTNTDTYFHLRFGHEFLHGHWSLWDPGSVTTYGTNDWVPTQWLPQVVMAQFEDWFGLAGVAWLSGLLYLAARLHPLVDRPSLRQPAGGRAGDRGRRPGRQRAEHVDAPAGAELPLHRAHDGRLAAHPRGRQGALVAGPADVGVGHGPRHVVDRHHHRRRRRLSVSRWTARCPSDSGSAWPRSPCCPLVVRGPDTGRARSSTRPSLRSTRAATTSPSGSRRTSEAPTASRC